MIRPKVLCVCSVFAVTLALGAESPDVVKLKDGSILKGSLTSMTGGSLTIQTEYAGAVTVNWPEVTSVKTGEAHSFVLSDGTQIKGQVTGGEAGTMIVSSENLAAPAEINVSSVTAINPPKEKPIKYKGNINVGASASEGNTKNRSVTASAGFEARSERQRLTLGARTNYAEDSDGVTERNSKGTLKYDFFATERLFAFASAFLEGDEFQDLNLRTALSAGPGYQFIEQGDFEPELLSGLEMYGEAGVSYFNEDFETGEDKSYVSGRWAVKLDWPVYANRITFFHTHEGYPGFEDVKDFYVTTETGLRFAILENLNSTIQVNWRYDNTPSKGYERTDTLYLFTLGYNFNL